jgi:predicted nucleotidyltransferase
LVPGAIMRDVRCGGRRNSRAELHQQNRVAGYSTARLTFIMVPMRAIRRYCNAIATAFRPQRIILFGSHATGTADANSDVDLLVVTARAKPHSRRRRLSLEIRQQFNPDFPVDIIVRDPAFVASA